MSTHYDTLGVAPGASASELRKAYLRRARALHPDRQQGRSPADARRAEEAMRQVNVAWNVLSDKQKRSDYDGQLNAKSQPRRATQQRSPAARRPTPQAESRQRTNPTPTSSGAKGRSIDDEPGDGSVSIWASLPVLIVVGIGLGILIVTAFGGSEGGLDNRPIAPSLDDQMRDGNCFVFVGDSLRIESCSSGRADAEVIAVVPDPGNCPAGTESLQEGEVVLCYARLIPGSAITVPDG